MDNLIYKIDKTRDDVNKLMQRHKNLVYRILADFGYLGRADCESAGFEALWNAIETFDVFSQTAFSTYACVCIKNAINDTYRKEKARVSHEVVEDFTENELTQVVFDVAIDVESTEATQKILQFVREYLDKIGNSTKSAKAMHLWYSTQFTMTPSDIAKCVGTTTSIVCRAQQMLRAYLSGRLKEK